MLLIALQISLITIGLNAATWEGMIFHKVRQLTFYWPVWIKKPLYECTICMSSFWTLVYWFTSGGSLCFILLWLICIVAGINTLVDYVIGFLLPKEAPQSGFRTISTEKVHVEEQEEVDNIIGYKRK